MQNSDEVLKGFESSGLRAFGEDGVRRGSEFVPYHEAKKRPRLSQMKKIMFNCLSEDKYQELEPYFNSYTSKEIEGFFRKEGKVFFSWGLVNAPSALPLKWLIDNVSPGIVHDILTINEFSVLAGFLGGQKIMENRGDSTENGRAVVVEKLKILLQLNDANVSAFIKHNATEKIRLKLTV